MTKKETYEIYPNIYSNKQQTEAINKMIDFLQSDETEFLLSGQAGTGKSTIIRYIVRNYKKGSIGGFTPTHKAKKILSQSLGNSAPVSTLASGLAIRLNETTGEFQPDTYLRSRGEIPIREFDLLIIDECSMIKDNLLEEIRDLKRQKTKIIFMGDKNQLPPVGQDDDSKVFEIENTYNLTEKMRQHKDSPIIQISDLFVDNLDNGCLVHNPILSEYRVDYTDENSKSSVIWLTDENDAIDYYVKEYNKNINNPNHIKMVTFNNENNKNAQSVGSLNTKVREKLFGSNDEQFYVGELLVANDTYYKTKKSPVPEYETSEDLIVVDIKPHVFNDVVSVYSKDRGARKLAVRYNVIYLTLRKENNTKIRVPVIANSDKDKFNDDIAELFKKDGQLAYGVQQLFGNLTYGYAISTHKSQGSTYNSCVVFEDNIMGYSNMGTVKAKNQSLYVAITRPRHNLVVVGC